MAVTLSGVYSGIDSNSIIAQLMAIESRPLYRLEARKQLNQYRENAVTEIETILSQLDGLVDTIRDSDDLRSVTASSTDTDILTAHPKDIRVAKPVLTIIGGQVRHKAEGGL